MLTALFIMSILIAAILKISRILKKLTTISYKYNHREMKTRDKNVQLAHTKSSSEPLASHKYNMRPIYNFIEFIFMYNNMYRIHHYYMPSQLLQ